MKIASYVFLSAAAATQFIFVLLDLQLLLLHRWLKKHDLTTYEYILFLRMKEENPNLKLDVENIRKNHKSKVLTRVKEENSEVDMSREDASPVPPKNLQVPAAAESKNGELDRQSSGTGSDTKKEILEGVPRQFKQSCWQSLYDFFWKRRLITSKKIGCVVANLRKVQR